MASRLQFGGVGGSVAESPIPRKGMGRLAERHSRRQLLANAAMTCPTTAP
jgi:hypothetical protein